MFCSVIMHGTSPVVIARSEATKQSSCRFAELRYGLLRGACHRARIRATRWLANDGLSQIQFSNSQEKMRVRDLAARCARVVLEAFALKKRGRGECRVSMHPQPRV